MSDKLTKIIQLLMLEDEDNDDLLILLALLLDIKKKERTAKKAEMQQEQVSSPNENIDSDLTKKKDLPPSDDELNIKRDPQLFCKHCSQELQDTKVEDLTKVLIARVYHYFECEYEELKQLYGDLDLTPLSKFRQRTALATGVSETTVLQILKEEESRKAEKREEFKRSTALKRSLQTKSSSSEDSSEDSSDDSVSDGEQPSNVQEAQNEAELETLVVKLEPECDTDKVQISTDSVQVKAEPPDDDVTNTSETLAVTEPEILVAAEPAATKRRGRKSMRKSDVTFPRRQTQGEFSTAAASTAAASTAAASSSVRLTEELDESGLSEETEVKVEKIEIGEERFS